MIKGVDISRWQYPVNFKTLLALIRFLFYRISIGYTYLDPRAQSYSAELIALATTPFGVYHVIHPDLDADKQAAWLITCLEAAGLAVGDKLLTPLPLVLDLELDNGQSKSTITRCIEEVWDLLEMKYDRDVMGYSRTSWLIEHMDLDSAKIKRGLWFLAYYPNVLPSNPTSLVLPSTMDAGQVEYWQYSKNGPGKEMGVGSGNVDLDMVLWTTDEYEWLLHIVEMANLSGKLTDVSLEGFTRLALGLDPIKEVDPFAVYPPCHTSNCPYFGE